MTVASSFVGAEGGAFGGTFGFFSADWRPARALRQSLVFLFFYARSVKSWDKLDSVLIDRGASLVSAMDDHQCLGLIIRILLI